MHTSLTRFAALACLASGLAACSQSGARQLAATPLGHTPASARTAVVVSAPAETAAPLQTVETLAPPSPLPTLTPPPTATLAPDAVLAATMTAILSDSNGKPILPLPDGVRLLHFTLSPDGQYVVYILKSADEEDETIMSVGRQGGVPVRLGDLVWAARNDLHFIPPFEQYVITPDSRAVIFQKRDGLYLVPIGGGAAQQIGQELGASTEAGPMTLASVVPSLHNMVADFRLFPVCSCLIYRTKTALVVLGTDGALRRTYRQPIGKGTIYGYTLTADGRDLLFDTRFYDLWDEPKTPSAGGGLVKIIAVYAVALDSGTPRLLARAPTADGAIDSYEISPDGADLLYKTYDNDLEGGKPNFRTWRVPLSGGAAELLAALP